MNIKTKKQNQDGIVRLETSGDVKEVIINEDFLNPNDASIALCFKGKSSSGIVELTPKEVDYISKQLSQKMHLLGNVKIIKFKK
jgi:hypothetical protein|tara:strand:- start:7345 stop:7596 length:252 start_codon:yes stop_codon:yes gene_type:complete